MSRPTVYVGARAPEDLIVIIDQDFADVPLAMTTVTAVSFDVTKPDGSTTAWSATISEAIPTQLTATHTFDVGGLEVAVAGRYVLVPQLTVPAGMRRAQPINLTVRSVTSVFVY